MEKCSISTNLVQLFGTTISAVNLDQVLDIVDKAVCTRKQLHIGVVNAAKIVNMRDDTLLREGVLQSDLIIADGMAVVWASRILNKKPLQERVTGIDLMFGMFERGKIKGYRVYLLGATEEVSEQVAKKLASDYPGVILAGRRNGYFSEADEQGIAEHIAACRTDILLVAITSPKKEKFMAKWADFTQVPVIHGVGGSFDVMAGKVDRAPEVWQKYGLEWLYRVKQEPGRLWKRYFITNIKFCFLVFGQLLASGKS